MAGDRGGQEDVVVSPAREEPQVAGNRPAKPWTVAAIFIALNASAAIGRVEQNLAAVPGSVTGGVGTLASPVRLFLPRPAVDVAAAWKASTAQDPVKTLTRTYLMADLSLIASLSFLMLAWALRQSRDVRLKRRFVVPVAVYALADVSETLTACLAWRIGYPSLLAQVVGGASLVKWSALATALVILVGSAVPQPSPPRLLSLPVDEVLDRILRFRVQVFMSGVLLLVFILLTSDIGRQIDDVLARTAESLLAVVITMVFAVAATVAVCLTGIRCAWAYEGAPTRDPLKAPTARAGLCAAGLGSVALFGLGAWIRTWQATFHVFAVLSAMAALFFALSLAQTSAATSGQPEMVSITVRRTGASKVVGGDGQIPPFLSALVLTPLLVLTMALTRTVVTQSVETVGQGLLVWWVMCAAVFLVAAAVLGRYPSSSNRRPMSVKTVASAWMGAAVLLAVLGWTLPNSAVEGMGTPAVIFMWVLMATLGLSALVLLADRFGPPGALAFLRRWPVVAALVVWSVLASAVDQHGFYYDARLTASSSSRQRPVLVRAVDATPDAPAGAYQAWLGQVSAQRKGQASPAVVPLVFVAAAGGGIRAAYWTAATWDCAIADQCDPGRAATDDRSSRVFLASGTSGGSLGLATVRSLQTDPANPQPTRPGGALTEPAAGKFDTDFVAAAMAGYLFKDLPNSLLRAPIPGDRAARLESAWEETNPNLAQGFLETGITRVADQTQPSGTTDVPRFPLLVLNSTSVEDGCHLAVSTVELQETDCANSSGPPASSIFGRDAVDYLCRPQQRVAADLPLSTAALLSARFPFVSPAGGLTSCADADRHTYALDGGIVDNSGAAAISHAWSVIDSSVEVTNQTRGAPCVVPRLLIIDNHPSSSMPQPPGPRPVQGRAPLQAALGTFGNLDDNAIAQASITISAAAEHAIETCTRAEKSADIEADHAVVTIQPSLRPGTRAPLGWTLSHQSITRMNQELQGDSHCADPSDRSANCEAITWIRNWWPPA